MFIELEKFENEAAMYRTGVLWYCYDNYHGSLVQPLNEACRIFGVSSEMAPAAFQHLCGSHGLSWGS